MDFINILIFLVIAYICSSILSTKKTIFFVFSKSQRKLCKQKNDFHQKSNTENPEWKKMKDFFKQS